MDDAAGFSMFVRQHSTTLLRAAYLLTGDRGAAEELLQDTLVRLYPQWSRVQAADVPMAYVRRSLTNNFLNGRRRHSSQRPAVRRTAGARLRTGPGRPARRPGAGPRTCWTGWPPSSARWWCCGSSMT